MAVHTATTEPIVSFVDASPHTFDEARRYFTTGRRRITLHLSHRGTPFTAERGIAYPFTAQSERDPQALYEGEIYADGTGHCSCPSHHACKHLLACGWVLETTI